MRLHLERALRGWFSFSGSLSLKKFSSRGIAILILAAACVLSLELLELGPVPKIVGSVLALSLSSLVVRRLRDSRLWPALVVFGVLPFVGWGLLAVLVIVRRDSAEDEGQNYQNMIGAAGACFLSAALLSWLYLLG